MNIGNRIFKLTVMIALLVQFGCQSNSVDNKVGEMEINGHWKMQAQQAVEVDDEMVSAKGFDDKNWINVELPSTVLNGLVKAGVYSDIYYGNNLEKIDTKQFEQAWWYRTSFDISDVNQFYKLVFEGVNYSANIWLNGQLLADSSLIEGAFGIWNIDASKYIIQGENILAVQVFPPKFDDLTIGFVDWNPAAPDKNLGIWRPVKLVSCGAVSMSEPFVQTDLDVSDLSQADVKISTTLTNHSDQDQNIGLNFSLNDVEFSKLYNLRANQEVDVVLSSADFKALHMENPKLWWPNLMGEPNLYTLNTELSIGSKVSDQKSVRFGIRKIEDYWNAENHRGYKVNGKPVLIKGAGWVDDILLADSDEKVRAQVEYVKHMNMNCIRLEGFWGKNKTLYEAADELGLLLMIGWSCHWEWEGYCGRFDDDYMAIRTAEDQELQARAFQDQVRWLRNHASVFVWVYGSDKLPLPELETKLNEYVSEVDGTRPILASCKGADFDIVRNDTGELVSGYINESEISGSTGVKMLGPYAYTAPIYWYVDERAGGAFGFNTETGPGAQVPPLESIKKMIPEDQLWPINDMWDYHSGRHEFSNLDRDVEAFNARYGATDNVEDFAFNMQISNYEAIRAMFEAFEVNKHKATGIVQWMLNSAWPEMFWQLYDWYLMPNGAFYGTQKANQPLNAIYNYKDKNIYIGNSHIKSFENVDLMIKVLDINSEVLFEKSVKLLINENESKLAFEMPELENLSTTYFIDLRLVQNDKELALNFYWLSTKPDVFDWENSEWFFSPFESYADFTALNTMAKAKVGYSFSAELDADGNVHFSCNIENTSDKLAFFIELAILDKATGETIVPVFWDDNYVSLLPGEKREIKAKLRAQDISGKEFEYRVKGFNLK